MGILNAWDEVFGDPRVRALVAAERVQRVSAAEKIGIMSEAQLVVEDAGSQRVWIPGRWAGVNDVTSPTYVPGYWQDK
jgi:hypothetical protein